MSKPIHNSSGPSPTTGYSLVELMVAMGLSLLLLGLTFTLFNQLYSTADLASTMGDVNENLRAAVNAVSRDLSTAGSEIPPGGIPIPNGGTATAINRPGPPGTPAFPLGTTTINVITPGDSLGPTQGSGGTAIKTDIVTMISVNPASNLDQYTLTALSYSVTAATVTVDTRTSLGPGSAQVLKGQLIMLSNTNASCLLAVTDVNTGTGVITFTHGDATNDPLGINQFSGPASGMIKQLNTTGSPPTPPVTAYHISMVTYYLDTSTPPRLMKQSIMGAAQPVALGIPVLQFSYSLSPPGSPDPTDNPASPNTIRKANLWMIAEADHRNKGSGQFYSKSIALSVTVQNLAYFNRY
jgi:type II secretory pathway pseudopilin PulG